MFVNQTLKCQSCKQQFTWTVEEQERDVKAGKTGRPKYCPDCQYKKENRRAQYRPAKRMRMSIVCIDCGKTFKTVTLYQYRNQLRCPECQQKFNQEQEWKKQK